MKVTRGGERKEKGVALHLGLVQVFIEMYPRKVMLLKYSQEVRSLGIGASRGKKRDGGRLFYFRFKIRHENGSKYSGYQSR